MNAFQTISTVILGLLTLFSIVALIRKKARPLVALAWILVWIASIFAILLPNAVTTAAHFLGIQRGADLVLYGAVITGMLGFFYLLTKFRATRRQITILTRKLAILEAELDETRGTDSTGQAGEKNLEEDN